MIKGAQCHRCPLNGQPQARGRGVSSCPSVMIVGDSPTVFETTGGLPMTGEPGKILRGTMSKVGLSVQSTYHTYSVLCLPKEKGTIPKEATDACRERLLYEIGEVNPDLVLSLGSNSAKSLLGVKGVTRARGQLHRIKFEEYGVDTRLMATFSPSAIPRDPDLFRDFSFDLAKAATQREPIDFKYSLWIPSTVEETREMLYLLSTASLISCDLETTGFDYEVDPILTVGFGVLPTQGDPISIIITGNLFRQMLPEFRTFFELFQGTFIFHNVKFDIQYLRWAFQDKLFKPRHTMDTMLMQYSRDERGMDSSENQRAYFSVGLKDLGRQMFDIPDFHFDFEEWLKPLKREIELGTPLDDLYSSESTEVDWTNLIIYHGLDCSVTIRLYVELKRLLELESPKLMGLADFLTRASLAYAVVEMNGIQLDMEYLKEFQVTTEETVRHHLEKLQEIALRVAGIETMNPGSSPQVKKVFAALGIDIEKGEKETIQYEMNRTKYPFEIIKLTEYLEKSDWKMFSQFVDQILPNGAPKDVEWTTDLGEAWWDTCALYYGVSMDATRSRKERASEPYYSPDAKNFLANLLEYRQQSKLLSTYVVGLQNRADHDGRIRADFLLHGTDTGRLSARNPNLQNIPAVVGPMIRRAFVARPGWAFLNCDYSQLELRVAAFYSRDANLTEAFIKGVDVHRWVASLMFKKPPEEITKFERYLAKYVDFGFLYGRDALSLMHGFEAEYIRANMGRYLTKEECLEIQQSFFNGFPQLSGWIQRQHDFVRKFHYIETPTGRRRRFPYVDWKSSGSVERKSVNTPCQSLASDMTTAAIICLADELDIERALITSSVHDSIMFEVREDYVEEAVQIIRRCMETPCIPEFDVPLRVDIAVGRTSEGKGNWAALGE